MGVDNVKISKKGLIPIALMAVTVLAMVALGANRLAEVGSTAREIIKSRDVGEVDLARAARRMVFLPFDVLGMIAYDNDDAGGQAAAADYKNIVAETNKQLDEAAALLPTRAAAVSSFKFKFADLVAKSKLAYDLGEKAPGIVHGRELKPEDLDDLAAASKAAIEIDIGTRALVKDMRAFGNDLLKENAGAAEALEIEGRNAVWTLAAIGIVATLAVGAVALWVSSVKVARPLSLIVARMKALAAGDLDIEVGDDRRRDEIGDIARAVQTFKANAIERRRIERDAHDHRAATEVEREHAQQERERDAEELATALQALGQGLSLIAHGDLTTRLDDGFTERYARIRGDFNGAFEKLLTALRGVVDSAETIRTGTQQISDASDNLSQRTEQQAANLEETAAALSQITESVRQSAEGAKHARDVVEAADADAKDGAIVVKQAIEAMDAISASSTQIGTIISTVDEIAFQTNLLALNAGVEAARAGDSGRGFAVVASEVRSLAQRSAEAAKEIKTLVSRSATTVESGVQLVAKTGAALQRIIAQVMEIRTVVTQIAAGAAEQATAIREVNEAISNIDRTTQQNATIVEESTAASHSLGQETEQLSRLVEQFNVGSSPASKPIEKSGALQRLPTSKMSKKAVGSNLTARRAVGGEDWTDF